MDLSVLEERIGHRFAHSEYLREAVTHRSYLNENRSRKLSHNERLEFLGDAVLELIVTEHLFVRFPEVGEGVLTAYRAALVNTADLAIASRALGVEEHLLLSRGEAKDAQGKGRQEILGNTYEAVVGALYLDGGYGVARVFVERTVLAGLDAVIQGKRFRDPKSRFQELAQAATGITPTYAVVRESGPDHDRKFVVEVCIGNESVAQGEGRSKQEAETKAAQGGMRAKGWEE
jgi:ribonuclease-3